MFGMFLIDGGANNVFMLESRIIFFAACFQPGNQFPDANSFGRKLDEFFSLADFSRTQAK